MSKPRPTISRVQYLLNTNRNENAEALRKSGRNVAEQLGPNTYEHVEEVEFTPTENYFIKSNVEHSRENIAAGLATPQHQIRRTGVLAPSPKAPGAPMKKRKTMRRRKSRKTRRSTR